MIGGGWIYSGEKIILIERYLDGDAMMQHAKNISEGGILETHFVKFKILIETQVSQV